MEDNKKLYIQAEISVILLDGCDVVTTSGAGDGVVLPDDKFTIDNDFSIK